MIDLFLRKLQQDTAHWNTVKEYFQKMEVAPKTTLLSEGEISRNLYFIKKGCLRLWFNNDGKDMTFQFFFEKQAVASIESYFIGQPSLFSLQSIESCSLIYLQKENFDVLYHRYSGLKDAFMQLLLQRLENYQKLFLSRIKDSPRKRYEDLLNTNPEIARRVPQHYIASYLGITPVSLSRIRNKQ